MELVPLLMGPQRVPLPPLPRKDTVKRQLSVNQETGPPQTLNLLAP